ncbi:MAG TPA: HD domain-containing phosphohydrolase, partial [Gammaproteobacteria bacterium]|nr:HD domain-containing phosphohydrolase [Gammaproteobacteria bacterium]
RFGYQLLMKFAPFEDPARIVRFHHVSWEHGRGREAGGEPVPMTGHIVHLADRVDALLDGEGSVLQQGRRVLEQIWTGSGETFVPEHVDAFAQVAASESFWLDLASPHIDDLIAERTPFSPVEMDMDGLLDFAGLLAQVIDFRSRYTATHSSGVAACAAALADLIGFSEGDCKRLEIAGYLHDIGKLAIPVEVLEQDGELSPEDRLAINTHSYHSYRILAPIRGLEDIAAWCGMHHERLTGRGYPFRAAHADIPLEARVLAVADVFTALTEDRPYRAGMEQEKVLQILEDMVRRHGLDAKVVGVLQRHYEVVDRCRIAAQSEAVREYREFMEGLAALDLSGARASHLAWRERLRAFLDGEERLNREQVVSHHECSLGRWYYSEGLHHYGHIPEMEALEAPHAELHRLVEQAVQLHEQGRTEQAEACFQQVHPLSERIVGLLEAIEHKAAESVAASFHNAPQGASATA